MSKLQTRIERLEEAQLADGDGENLDWENMSTEELFALAGGKRDPKLHAAFNKMSTDELKAIRNWTPEAPEILRRHGIYEY